MPLSLRVVFRLMVGFAAAVLLSASASAADPTPKQLAAQLRETLTGLHTIEMRYRRTLANNDGEVFINEWEWIRDGERELLRSYWNPKGLPQSFWSFDGRHGYSVGTGPERPEFPREIIKSLALPSYVELSFSPAQWLGLELMGFDENLIDLLERPEARLLGSETRAGLTVHRIETVVDARSEAPWTWTISLCPERDGLPVEIVRAPADHHPKRESFLKYIGTPTYAVSSFMSVEDEALGRRRWLPERMRYESVGETVEQVVSSVRVNHEVPGTVYVPSPQPGTAMIDETVPGRRKIKIHMPERAMKRQAERMAAAVAASEASPPVRPAVAAPSDPGRWWRLIRWTAALALLAAGALFAVRSWRTR